LDAELFQIVLVVQIGYVDHIENVVELELLQVPHFGERAVVYFEVQVEVVDVDFEILYALVQAVEKAGVYERVHPDRLASLFNDAFD
jgi:hypothetical protein